MSKAVWLRGLNVDYFPLSALMAYGILRILVEERGLKGVRLAFDSPYNRPVAGLEAVNCRCLLKILQDHILNIPPLPDGLPQKKGKLQDVVRDFQREAVQGNPRARTFAPSLYLPRSGKPLLTPLDTSKAQQGFITVLNWASGVAKQLALGGELRRTLLRILLQSPLLYPGESLPGVRGFKEEYRIGWHHSQRRQGAEQARKPAKEKEQETVRIHPVAILLAWESVPLFTLYPGTNGPMGAGFLHVGSANPTLLLPIPGAPVSLEELRILLFQAPLCCTSGSKDTWPPMVALWQSQRLGSLASKEAYPVFAPAEVWRGP